MIESGIAWWLSQHLLITTALAAIVYLICHVARPNPATRHILWLLVLCRLLVPPVATWPWSIPDPLPTLVDDQYINGHDVGAIPPSAFGGNVDRATIVAAESAGRVEASPRFQMAWLIAGLWIAGSLIAAAVLFRRIRRVGQLLKAELDIDPWLQNETADWCNRLSMRMPDCVVHSKINSPFLWCLGCVRLVWPLSVLHSGQREQVRPILIHELAHLKRRDHWTAWIELIALIIWWWNPMLWFVRRQLRISAEMACDAWVVKLLPDQRRTYAESLVRFSGRSRTFQRGFGAVGANTCSRRTFKRRLEMIMKENLATRFSKCTAFAAILLVALSLPAFALKSFDQPEDSEMQSRIGVSSDLALDENVAQFSQPMNEKLFADESAVFRNEGKLDPKNSVVEYSEKLAVQSGKQERRSTDSKQESSSDPLMESNTGVDIYRNTDPILAAKQLELARLSSRYSPDHPDVIRLIKDIEDIEERLAKESSETAMVIPREQDPVSAAGQSGQASQQEKESSDLRLESSPIPKDFIIGVNDLLRIDVWKEPELSVEEAVVRPDGKISIPPIGDVRASGRTPVELKAMVEAQLRKFVPSPIVTVVVLQFRPQSVSIVGKIENPGVYYLDSSITVLELLARAGGCSEFADVKNIAIVRKNENQSRHFKFNYKDVVMGHNLENNIILENGDVVIVP